jgi:hypothetical protein
LSHSISSLFLFVLFFNLDSILRRVGGMWSKQTMTDGKTPSSLMIAEHLQRFV